MEIVKEMTGYTTAHKLEIVKNHFIPGAKVSKYSEISGVAVAMRAMLEAGINKGEYETGYALAHNQIEDKEPMAFFVVNKDYVGEGKMFEAHAIINPEIIEAPTTIDVEGEKRNNIYEVEEGCFSFPFRQPKKTKRYFKIKVRYYIPGRFFGLKKIEKWIEGLPAHIYQHETDHVNGLNIYFDK
ncbi:MAG TPA: hypothetical protein DIT25_03920 [Candidatus Moranbacteria bacterium]|nr:hypothetical protein [Candidatus Moranbacteria bacterium]